MVMQMRRPRHGSAFAFHAAGMYGERPGSRQLRRGQTVIVQQWERGLLLQQGRFQQVLEPGQHRIWQPGCTVRIVDMRPWVVTLPVQEVPTADGATVKVTVAGHARVADVVIFVTAARNPEQSLHLAVQVALRDLLAGVSVEELLAGRSGLGERLLAALSGADRLGITVDELVIKDIMLSGELKKAQSELLVARAQGIAALERARGETAALRGLANAARMAASNPALLQLRLLQQLGTSSGHTVIIGTAPAPAIGQVLTGGRGETPAGPEAS
jgi:regulator of protease activity HflC (stomatin/prohibitin superfamily)